MRRRLRGRNKAAFSLFTTGAATPGPATQNVNVPNKTPSKPKSAAASVPFRQRFDDLERRRKQLLDQLNTLAAIAGKHPGYRNALTLLTSTFRRASLAQRAAVLQSAAWLIGVLEQLPPAGGAG